MSNCYILALNEGNRGEYAANQPISIGMRALLDNMPIVL